MLKLNTEECLNLSVGQSTTCFAMGDTSALTFQPSFYDQVLKSIWFVTVVVRIFPL